MHIGRKRGGKIQVTFFAMERAGIHALVESAEGLTGNQKALLQARVVPLMMAAEAKALTAERWDNGLFLGGFCGSLVVTIATAINLAGYVTPTAASAVSTGILVLSSLATATLALRERLRLRESVVLYRRFASLLQKAFVLFFAQAAPYSAGPAGSYQAFVRDVETIKGLTDQAQLRLREEEAPAGAVQPSPTTTVQLPPSTTVQLPPTTTVQLPPSTTIQLPPTVDVGSGVGVV